MIVSPLLVRSKTSEVLRVTSRTPIVVVVMPICYHIEVWLAGKNAGGRRGCRFGAVPELDQFKLRRALGLMPGDRADA
jgi:hypothetical protein